MHLRGITINTDASFCPNTKAAAFAFWIRSDKFVIKNAGLFREATGEALEAEIKSIGNAVYAVLNFKGLVSAGWICINTDCVGAISFIKKGKDETGKKVRSLVKNLEKKTGAKVTFKHVRAHSGTQDARSYVNEWCDDQAKIYMKKQRKKIMKCRA